MATLLISQTYFQAKSIVNDNVDWEMVKPILTTAQDLYLQETLGTDLYVKLQADVDALNTSSTPIPANYKNLLDNYVQPFLNWKTVSLLGNALKFRYMNKGVMEKNSDNSQPVSDQSLKFASQEWSNYADQYNQNLIKFLLANWSLFPELATNTTLEKSLPASNGFKSPLYFPEKPNFGLTNDTGDFRYRDVNKDWWKY